MGIIEFDAGTWIPWVAAGFGLSLFALEAAFVVYIGPSLRKLHGNVWANKKSPNITLTYSPNSLHAVDMVAIIFRLLLRYVPGYGTRLEIREEQDADRASFLGYVLPSITIESPLRLSPSDISAFIPAMKLLKSEDFNRDAAVRNEFLLVSLTTPMLLILLSHPCCPINPVGAVNTHNRFSFFDPKSLQDTAKLLELADARKLSVKAEMGGAKNYAKRKRRGIEFNVRITVLKEGKPLMLQELSFLQFLAKSQKPVYVENPKDHDKNTTSPSYIAEDALQLNIDVKAPIRWAASSKDYNPIHVSKIVARMLGYSSTIAHGNHIAALMIQKLQENATSARENKLSSPEQCALDICWNANRATWLEITFRKPMMLPIELGIVWRSEAAANVEFVVLGGTGVHSEGRIGYL